MGIHDRDYMKRRLDDDRPRGSAPDSDPADFLSGFLERNPRIFRYLGIGIGILTLIAVVAVILSKAR